METRTGLKGGVRRTKEKKRLQINANVALLDVSFVFTSCCAALKRPKNQLMQLDVLKFSKTVNASRIFVEVVMTAS